MSKFELAVRLYKTYLIAEALKRFKGNQSAAARDLGLHRNTLRRSMGVLGIKVDHHRPPKRVHQPTPLALAALKNQGWEKGNGKASHQEHGIHNEVV